MKSPLPNSRGLFLGIFILVFGAALARGQNGAVTIKLGAALAPNSYIYLSCLPTADNPTGSVGFSANGVSTARVMTDTIYSFNGQCAGASNGTVTFAAPAGYQVFVQGNGGGGNGSAGGSVGSFSYGSSGTYYFQGTFIVTSPNAWTGRAGAASSITSGQVRWSVALGNFLNGTSAGALSIVDPGTESSWSALWAPASLQYWLPSAPYTNPEVTEKVGSNGDIQIFVDQASVDVVPITSTEYEIRFYTPVVGQVFTGTPYVTYRVQQAASGSPTSLQITKFDYNTSGSVVHTAITTLTRSGSGMNSYQWILDDWNDLGQQQLIEESRQWGGTATNRTETLTKYQPGGSLNLSVVSQYQTYNWGEELVSTAVGPLPASTNTYITAGGPTSPSYGLLQASVSPSGNWTGYDYSTYSGVTPPVDPRWWFSVQDQYQPFNNLAEPGSFSLSQGAVTTYQYYADVFGTPTRPASSVTHINGVQVSNSSTLYADPALPATVASRPGFDVVQAVRSDCPSSGGTPLKTTSNYFREDTSDAFLTSQTTSTIQPDGSEVSYAYQRGTFIAGSAGRPGIFTEGTSNAGTASCITVITGTSNSTVSGTTECTSFGGLPIDPIYLVPGESTARLTMRNTLALVGCVETYAWVNGAWVSVDFTNYTYDAAGHLTGTVSENGATTSATYVGDEKTSETDATGVTVNYTYDYAGRVLTSAKSTGPKTTFAYDALGHITSQTLSDTGGDQIQNTSAYDVAGRLYSTTPAGLGTSYYAYAYGANAGGVANAAYAMTTTYADASTKIEASQLDGRALSVRGSSVVEQDYAYAVESNGDIQTTATIGGSGSLRSSTTLADWLGRTVSETTPGFTGQPSFVKTSIYDGGGWAGHLTEADQTGLAPTKYQYDPLGNLCRSGLDLGGGLTPASNDRITDTRQVFESYSSPSVSSGYWFHRESIVYPTSGSGTQFTVSITRTRLTGFAPGQLSETLTTDSNGNTTDSVVSVIPSTQTEIVTTTVPGAANPQVETTTFNMLKKETQGFDGLTTVLQYDNLERPSSVTDTRGNTSTTAYFAGSSLVHTVTDPTGAVLATYTYDALGRKTSVVNASEYVSYFAYTPMGQVQEQWGSSSPPISYGYDAYGERTSMTTYRSGPFTGTSWPNPTGGDTTLWNYDGPSGLLGSKTDASGNSVSYNYYSDGQVSSRTWARLLSINPLKNALTSYSYDTTGALLGTTYNDATTPVAYTYTRTGQLNTVTDATGTRNFNYDPAQLLQLDSISLNGFYNNLVLSREYDSDGLLSGRPTGFELGTPAFPAGLLSQTYAYNGNGYFTNVTTSTPAGSTKFDYAYQGYGQLLSGLSVDGSNVFNVTRSYEAQRNLLIGIETQTGGSATTPVTQFNYGYNPQRQRFFAQQSGSAYADQYSGTSYNSVFNFYTYDGLGQLQSGVMYRKTPPGNPASPPSGADQLPGRSFQYRYDGFGNRASAGETGGSSDNAYLVNNLNQYSSIENNTVRILGDTNVGALVSVPGVTIDQTDRNFGGDLIPANASAPVYGSAAVTALAAGSGSPCPPVTQNYLVPAANQSLVYDVDGNLLADGIWSYTYDEENRLTSMTSIALSGWAESNVTISFTYDYLNRRVEKKVVNNATHAATFDHKYIYDGNNLVAEIDNLAGDATNGLMVRSYTWGLDVAGSLTATQGVGALLQITNYAVNGIPLSTPVSYFPSFDGNGNVASLINASSGALAAVYEYGPSGEPLRNQVLDSAIGDNPFRFSTKFTDVETKLVYYGARYYSPAMGRFINRDPLGEAGGGNLYAFCGNDGVNGFDVGGMASNLPTQAGPQFNAATQSYNYIQPDQTAGSIASFLTMQQGGPDTGNSIGFYDPEFQGGAHFALFFNPDWVQNTLLVASIMQNGLQSGSWQSVNKIEDTIDTDDYYTTMRSVSDGTDDGNVLRLDSEILETHKINRGQYAQNEGLTGAGGVSDPNNTPPNGGRAVDIINGPEGSYKVVDARTGAVISRHGTPGLSDGTLDIARFLLQWRLAGLVGGWIGELLGQGSGGVTFTNFSSAAEVAMIKQALSDLEAAGYDTSQLAEVIRADMPAGYAGMSVEGGAALGDSAFTSQQELTRTLEEELIHLQQKASGAGSAFGPGTAQSLEEEANGLKKF